jgi:hypothetical protein
MMDATLIGKGEDAQGDSLSMTLVRRQAEVKVPVV